MPRFDNYDLYDYNDLTSFSNHNTLLSKFFCIGIVCLLIYCWSSGLFQSKKKLHYIWNSVIEGVAMIFAPIMLVIGGFFYYIVFVLKFILGIGKDKNTKDSGCIVWIIWMYRLFFLFSIILLFYLILTR